MNSGGKEMQLNSTYWCLLNVNGKQRIFSFAILRLPLPGWSKLLSEIYFDGVNINLNENRVRQGGIVLLIDKKVFEFHRGLKGWYYPTQFARFTCTIQDPWYARS